MAKRPRFDIHEISFMLGMRRRNHQTTVLLLGSRAGALFRSLQFYEKLQKYSTPRFHTLSQLERFQECYALLMERHFEESDIHGILRTSLSEATVSRGDVCLAELIKQGHFEEIITTNVDNVLEQALAKAEMREGHEYEICVPGQKSLQIERNHAFRLTKAYGELHSRTYTVSTRSSYLDDNQELRRYLEHLLAKDVLVLGFDPVWDKDILRAFPIKGGALWFINEENLGERHLLSGLFKERRAKAIVGAEGSYESFVTRLYESLYGEMIPINYSLANKILEELRALREGYQTILNEIKKIHQ